MRRYIRVGGEQRVPAVRTASPGGGAEVPKDLQHPRTYDRATVGTGFFDVACGAVTFTVARGEQALCRFLVNGATIAHPDNTDRRDTTAWDAGNGGGSDWSSHSFAQVYRARCFPTIPPSDPPCTYRVTLQSRLLLNGATGARIDDLTAVVDVTVGSVTLSAVAA